ncbi:MAG: 2-oxo acid dehydrogenase subunit E2 [Candidatus Omnitrophica bacterium]|nr:2-oxo acid dehydrogenase subunit E2 [Candidatus Omnitrophota bacterium]
MLEFKLPEVGENISSGNVVNIFVSVGDTIKKDQDLLELETDKASLPVPSPVDGVVKEILIKTGQDVKIGQVVMRIEEGAASAQKSTPPVDKPKAETKTAVKEEPKPVEKKSEPAQAAAKPAAAPSASKSIPAQKDVAAAPSIRRLAREMGIEVSKVPGTGPGGRISEKDVKVYAKQLIQGGGGTGGGIIQKPLPDFSKWGVVEATPMSKIRQVTADHLSFCWQTIPHVTQFDKADITELEKLRKKYSTDKRKLTITPFLLKVMASALKTFPQFNSSVDMMTHQIIYKKFINMGVAVDTENGLLVPVIRDIDKKSILEINDAVVQMAQKARDRKIMPDDLKGGSMTLTNLGGIGGTHFTPIVNWPEVAILGVSRGGMEPVFENGQFIPRLKLPLSLSYDHRVIDGADGARFLRWICEAIEQPFMMELT